MRHPIHEAERQLGAYALGSLAPQEMESVESHLTTCDRCTELLSGYRKVAQALLHTAPVVEPPATLRAHLMSRLGQAEKRASAGWRADRQRLAWVGAALAIGALVVLNLAQINQVRALSDQIAAIKSEQRASRVSLALGAYPTSQVAVIDQGPLWGTFHYDPRFEYAVLYIWGLADPAPQHAYQAWLVAPDGGRESGGMLHFSEESEFAWLVVHASNPLGEFVGFGVTLEPRGGSPAPTGPRILGGDL